MTKIYMLLLEFAGGNVQLAKGNDGKHVVAFEGNQYLLNEIGDRLLEHDLIVGYQLISTESAVIRKL